MKQGMSNKSKALLRAIDLVMIVAMLLQPAAPAFMFAQEVPSSEISVVAPTPAEPAADQSASESTSIPAPEVINTEAAPVVESAVTELSAVESSVPAVVPSEPATTVESEPAVPTVEAAGEASTERVLPVWQIDGRTATTTSHVEIGKTYVAPQDDAVTVTFTRLPKEPGTLTVEEVVLTDEQVALFGAMSHKAYDISSDMEDGSFTYDLTLPKDRDESDAQIRFAESVSGLADADTVPASDVSVKKSHIDVTLDHFTVFVATYTPDFMSDKDVYARGESVRLRAIRLSDNRTYRITVRDSHSAVRYASSCFSRERDGVFDVAVLLASDAPTGTWTAELTEYRDGASEGHHGDSHPRDHDCSGRGTVIKNGTFEVVAPDLSISKTNDLGGKSSTVGTAFHWILIVTNTGNGAATFDDHREIIRDNMPSHGVSAYGMVAVNRNGGTTGTIRCFQSGIDRRDLSCFADGTVTIPAGGSVTVSVTVSPDATGTLVNPRAGWGNACVVDPSRRIDESDESDNACSDAVNVIPADMTVPHIMVAGAPEGWTDDPRQVGVTCSDDVSGCDVSSYRFKTFDTDPGTCDTSYESYALSAPLFVTTHEWVCVAGKDRSGNVGVSSPVEYLVDSENPTGTIDTFNLENGGSVVTNGWDGSIDGSANDAVSGVSRVELGIAYTPFGSAMELYWNGSGWQTSETRFVATGTKRWNYRLPGTIADGAYRISSQSIDHAGNVGNTYSITIVSDATAPSVNLAVSPSSPDGDNDWYVTRPQVTLSAGDNGSVSAIEYRLDGTGAWQTYENPVTLSDGTWHFTYRAIDAAGNATASAEKTVKADTKDPDEVSHLRVSWDKEKDGVQLSWNADDEDIDRVFVYRGKDKHFAINRDSLIRKNDRRDESMTDTDVKHGEKYYYKFVTRDEAGNRSDAKIVSVTIPESGNGITVKYEGTESSVGSATEEMTGTVEGARTDDGQSTVEGASVSNDPGNSWWPWLVVLVAAGYGGYRFLIAGKKKREEETPIA
ncbi:MAG TPA: hypothetical protein VN420_05595 [Candidatus Fimivivens sp.]|nr:hypothetical protein [Candidatus Fimivivens sp.]